MARKGRSRLRALSQRIQDAHPGLDADDVIRRGLVRVDGRVVSNPRSLVADSAVVSVGARDTPLRGEAKLAAALALFRVEVEGRVAMDLGASAGGFTRVLLRAGASRVYAVDVGFGQLVGSLRQHPSVVNLERMNIGTLSRTSVADVIDVVTVDLSYLSLAVALPQLEGCIDLNDDADLLALVKPMYELRLAEPPAAEADLDLAVSRAVEGATGAGWDVRGVARSPVTGQRGAIEFFLHGRRRGDTVTRHG